MAEIYEIFTRFEQHLMGHKDITLIVLKGHLLIEELLWKIVEYRVPRPDFVKQANFEHSQLIKLAQSVVDDFSEDINQATWVWPAVEKLNALRNRMAHDLEPQGIEDRIRDIVARVPAPVGEGTLDDHLVFALWIICQYLHHVIKPTTEADLGADGA